MTCSAGYWRPWRSSSRVAMNPRPRRRRRSGAAMGRHVEPGEVATLIAFLATDDCPSLTGATLDINGASYIR
ncbi:MAG TPA: hypothetical protein VH478_14500 [Trebonia sp.]|nr:hypothetical protein [Trebonia sp.]